MELEWFSLREGDDVSWAPGGQPSVLSLHVLINLVHSLTRPSVIESGRWNPNESKAHAGELRGERWDGMQMLR